MIYSSEFVSDRYMQLNSCGVQYLGDKDCYMIRPHGRKDYHILYIFQGVCHTEIMGEKAVVSEGNMILFKPYEKHKYEFHKKDLPISCYIHFTGVECEKLLNSIGFENERIINIGKSKTILSIFEKMEMEFNLKQQFSKDLCASYLIELLSLAGRRNSYSNNEVFLKNKTRINDICQFMYDNYSTNLSIEICAKKCNLSVSRFAHIFKETTGKAPLEYLTDIRISKAKELLANFNYSVLEVAEMVGFSSQHYFSRIFKKHTGISPKKYSQTNETIPNFV